MGNSQLLCLMSFSYQVWRKGINITTSSSCRSRSPDSATWLGSLLAQFREYLNRVFAQSDMPYKKNRRITNVLPWLLLETSNHHKGEEYWTVKSLNLSAKKIKKKILANTDVWSLKLHDKHVDLSQYEKSYSTVLPWRYTLQLPACLGANEVRQHVITVWLSKNFVKTQLHQFQRILISIYASVLLILKPTRQDAGVWPLSSV